MTIGDFDRMPQQELKQRLLECCASEAWAEKLMERLPAEDMIDLFQDAEEVWYQCSEEEWRRALSQTAETQNVDTELQKKYHDKFGYPFLISNIEEVKKATLTQRLLNTPEEELKIAAAELMSIIRRRLEQLLLQEQ